MSGLKVGIWLIGLSEGLALPLPCPLPLSRAVRGNLAQEREFWLHAPSDADKCVILCLRDSENRRDMRFTPSIFGKLLEPISRRHFKATVERHNGDAYDKSFGSHDHLVALIFAQFTAAQGLRGLEANWNANGQHHYHLASGKLARSTLSDASRRRPVAVFADTFALVANQLDSQMRREAKQMVQLIDSTPIPLGKLCEWGQVEWTHQGDEDACRLRPQDRLSAYPRHHRRQRQ